MNSRGVNQKEERIERALEMIIKKEVRSNDLIAR